ncbi:thioredoxin family protein [Chitinophaga lutea]|nr:thioredoxin family protein [Chitinophaga lutea]
MKYLLTLAIVLTTLLAGAQSSKPGIRFFKGSWRKALAEAQKTGKLVFVDVYTDWCVPCKKMEEEIFPLPGVGEVFNTHFINLQLDAESDGRFVAGQFNVKSYPTYLWVNGNGDLVYRAGGYNNNPRVFLAHANAALRESASGESEQEMARLYEEKKTDREFLRQYVARMHSLQKDTAATAALDQYLSLLTPAELEQPEQGQFLLKHVTDVQSRTFNYILDHQAFFTGEAVLTPDVEPDVVRRTNAEKLGVILSNLITETMMRQLTAKNDTLLNRLTAQSARIRNASVLYPLVFDAFRLHFLYRNYPKDRYFTEGVPFIDSLAQLPPDTLAKYDRLRFEEVYDGNDERNRHAYSKQVGIILQNHSRFYGAMFPAGKPEFERALSWAEKAVQYTPENPLVYENVCNLYIKAQRNEEAKKAIRTAMDLVSRQNNNEELLNTYKIKLESIP